MREIDTRYADAMLLKLTELKSGPLKTQRLLTERLVGCCREFTVLFLTLARAQGIPVGSRVGFVSYFRRGYYLEHEVGELWDEKERRWRLVDSGLGDDFTGPDGTHVNALDLPRDKILVAGAAWKMCRSGAADPKTFLVNPNLDIEKTRGWLQIRHNMLQDLAALNKNEMILWDTWSDLAKRTSDNDYPKLDRLAEQMSAMDLDIANLIRVYEVDPDLRIPDVVLSDDPLGGPSHEVSWRR